MTSTITLAEMQVRVLRLVRAVQPGGWETPVLEEAVRLALAEYGDRHQCDKIAELVLAADGREIALTALTGLVAVDRVWLPYETAEPWPPRWRRFEIYELAAGPALAILDGVEPQAADVARIWYRADHTIDGLAGATATTIPVAAEGALVLGAAGYGCLIRAAGEGGDGASAVARAADRFLERFRRLINAVEPDAVVATLACPMASTPFTPS